jgi:hypothetical protein
MGQKVSTADGSLRSQQPDMLRFLTINWDEFVGLVKELNEKCFCFSTVYLYDNLLFSDAES